MRRRVLVTALVLLVVAPATSFARHAAPCEGFEVVPHQGPSCPVEGGWRVLLSDGTTLETHGPDAPPADGLAGLASLPIAPVCVEASGPHSIAIYAVAQDRQDRRGQMAPTLRAMINESNGVLRTAAFERGARVDFTFLCHADSFVRVDAVVLPFDHASASFSAIVNGVRAAGYTSNLAKHWIWYDGTIPGLGGQGNYAIDDRLDAANANNQGGDYAITYGQVGSFGVLVLMHENGHNMGAVQRSAPNSSGAAHCNDGADIMCYADGGPTSNYRSGVCSQPSRYDCNFDDYFDPSPAPGSYLATHWNLGLPVNRYLDFGPSRPLLSYAWCAPTPANAEDVVTCGMAAQATGGASFEVDFGDGTLARVPGSGLAPSGTHLQIEHAWSAPGTYEVRVTPIDAAGTRGETHAFAQEIRCLYLRAGRLFLGGHGMDLARDVNWRDLGAIPAGCPGSPWTLQATSPNPVAMGLRICWRGTEGALGCDGGPAGTIPSGATGARIVLDEGIDVEYTLRVP